MWTCATEMLESSVPNTPNDSMAYSISYKCYKCCLSRTTSNCQNSLWQYWTVTNTFTRLTKQILKAHFTYTNYLLQTKFIRLPLWFSLSTQGIALWVECRHQGHQPCHIALASQMKWCLSNSHYILKVHQSPPRRRENMVIQINKSEKMFSFK